MKNCGKFFINIELFFFVLCNMASSTVTSEGDSESNRVTKWLLTLTVTETSMEPGESLSLLLPLGSTRSRREKKSKNTVDIHDAKTKNPGQGNKSVYKGRGKQESVTPSAQ